MKKGTSLPLGDVKKITEGLAAYLKRLLWTLGKHAFLLLLFLILLGVYFGQSLLYNYIFLVDVKEPEMGVSYTKFKEKEYQAIVKTWEVREKTYANSPGGTYSDPFENK